MKLMGSDFSPEGVMAYVGERLRARGLTVGALEDPLVDEPEAGVDPLTFHLEALAANADATQALPLETHREGLARAAVVVAKTVFRRLGQVFINEALGRQRVFNGHVRDSYAQLSAELLQVRKRLAELESAQASRPAEAQPRKKSSAGRRRTKEGKRPAGGTKPVR